MRKLNEKTRRLQEREFTGDENSKEYEATEFDGFGQYIANKVVKLQNQALEAANVHEEVEERTDIFKNCVIYVTGYTKPSLTELKHLITFHGGLHLQYFSGKTFATHIVATSLTARKRQEYAKFKVVKPDWIVDSIARKKLLPWSDYRTIDAHSSLAGPRFVISPKSNRPAAIGLPQSDTPEPFSSPESSHYIRSKRSHDRAASPSLVGLPHGRGQDDQVPDSPHLLDDVFDDDSDAESFMRGVEESLENIPNSKTEGTFDRSRVNCLDPDFIPSYYRNSRLHHLSTWKADLKRKFQKLAADQNHLRQSQSERTSSDTDRVIMHIDFDSFFVSVALLKRPDLMDQPVCICNSSTGNADIASCNYVARKYGVRNGMWMSSAIKKCPNLLALPYDFEGYEKASTALYDVLLSTAPDLLYPVSVDEALIDVTSLVTTKETSISDMYSEEDQVSDNLSTGVLALCSTIRNSIRRASGLEASVGAGPNVLLAKVALRKAKPSGQKFIPASEALAALDDVLLEDLPGVGRFMVSKIQQKFLVGTVGKLRDVSLKELQTVLGAKQAAKLHEYAFGRDSTSISEIPGAKSIGVEIAWGVRLQNSDEVDLFVTNLSKELASRMEKTDVKGAHMTIKLYRRAEGEPRDPPKFMGCGICDIFSKSLPMRTETRDPEVLAEAARNLVASFGCPPLDLRGIGIQIKLRDDDLGLVEGKRQQRTILDITDMNSGVDADSEQKDETSPRKKLKMLPLIPKAKQRSHTTLTQFSNKIDMAVLRELPTQIRKEVMEYEGIASQGSSVGTQLPIQSLQLVTPKKLEFFGRSGNEEVRGYLRDWIDSCPEPSYADVCDFEDFIIEGCRAAAWISTVRILEWMKEYVALKEGKWSTFVHLITAVAHEELATRGIRIAE